MELVIHCSKCGTQLLSHAEMNAINPLCPSCKAAGTIADALLTPPLQVKDLEREDWVANQSERNAPSEISDTLKERGSDYGLFLDQAEITQNLKSVMRATRNWHKLDPDMKEALEMTVHKIARILNGNVYKVDSWFDIEGYIKLVRVRIETGEKI